MRAAPGGTSNRQLAEPLTRPGQGLGHCRAPYAFRSPSAGPVSNTIAPPWLGQNVKRNKGNEHVVIDAASASLDRDPDNFAGSHSVDISERTDDASLVTDVGGEPGEHGALV